MKGMTTFFQLLLLVCVSMAANLQSRDRRGTAIGVGDVAPEFTLEDQDSHRVSLSDARGKSPIVLVFYRGYW